MSMEIRREARKNCDRAGGVVWRGAWAGVEGCRSRKRKSDSGDRETREEEAFIVGGVNTTAASSEFDAFSRPLVENWHS